MISYVTQFQEDMSVPFHLIIILTFLFFLVAQELTRYKNSFFLLKLALFFTIIFFTTFSRQTFTFASTFTFTPAIIAFSLALIFQARFDFGIAFYHFSIVGSEVLHLTF